MGVVGSNMLPSKPLIGLLALFLTLPAFAASPAVLSKHDYAWLKVASQARTPEFAQKIARGLAPSASRDAEREVAFEKSRVEFIDSYRKASKASQPVVPASALKPEAAAPLAGCSATGVAAPAGGTLLVLAWLAMERRRAFARARSPRRR